MRAIPEDLPELFARLIETPKTFQRELEWQPCSAAEIAELAQYACDVLSRVPNLVELREETRDVEFVGDTHGDIDATARIIQPFLSEQVESLVFLGDYVDRGQDGLANFLLVVALACAWPDRVFLLRGNHEDEEMNGEYGFDYELMSRYRDTGEYAAVKDAINSVFDVLSLAALSPRDSLAVHGGIARDWDGPRELNNIPKPHRGLQDLCSVGGVGILNKIFYEIRWNDPKEVQEDLFTPSDRGPGIYFFSQEALDAFLAKNNLCRLIRAHDATRGGFQRLFDGRLLHVFSTEPYHGQVPHAYVIHEQANGQTILRDLDFNSVGAIEDPPE
ncbi:MAG TPA: metallophosphoesterase [Candidatus Lokiarchaeia archaeon]|nr:metallophosphoesterase [Candidatus Lokiarchaeia archaeon]